MTTIETDYLVIGAGAMGLAFADTMLSESDADIVIVDRRHMPGGHWNDAYPFVRLHQPSLFYGVASMELGARRIDDSGSNKGFFELASGPEVLSYFDRVMRERLLPSGRVRFLPMHEVEHAANWSARLRGTLTGTDISVRVNKAVVDSTFINTTVPLTHKRKFAVDEGVACIPPNDLPRAAPGRRSFVILGAGKTAMDCAVWLLEKGVDPDAIIWVEPRASWLINRATTQPGLQFFDQSIGGFARQTVAFAEASDIDDLFDRLERFRCVLRIDTARRPEMMHYATICEGELELLRQIRNVVRGARVTRLTRAGFETVAGKVAAPGGALYIDCTATAFDRKPAVPVFAEEKITLGILRAPNPCLSAAIAARVEAQVEDRSEKNRLCVPIELSDTPMEWAASMLGNLKGQYVWSQTPILRDWIAECRLDGFGRVVREADRADPEVARTLAMIRDNSMKAAMNLSRLTGAPLQ